MISFAIHSHVVAEYMRSRLVAHGLRCETSQIKVSDSLILTELKVERSRLAEAVRLCESGLDYADEVCITERTKGKTLLIPVDFSEHSMLAVRAGFEFAVRLDMDPLLMHSYAAPRLSSPLSFAEGLDDMAETAVLSGEFRHTAEREMQILSSKIRRMQTSGMLPDLQFSTNVCQGIPEEAISDYCRVNEPGLIVMATRGKSRREAEMIGSVTAEVLDNCRVPVFTVPENITFVGVENINRLIFFCNLDRQDILSFDSFMSMFDCPEVDVLLVPVSEKSVDSMKGKTDDLRRFLEQKYPVASFHAEIFDRQNFRMQLEKAVEQQGTQLLIVPNKKTNIFSRLFKPGIAHRILFERDMLMLALPV